MNMLQLIKQYQIESNSRMILSDGDLVGSACDIFEKLLKDDTIVAKLKEIEVPYPLYTVGGNPAPEE